MTIEATDILLFIAGTITGLLLAPKTEVYPRPGVGKSPYQPSPIPGIPHISDAATDPPIPIEEQHYFWRDPDTGMTLMIPLREAEERTRKLQERVEKQEQEYLERYVDGLPY